MSPTTTTTTTTPAPTPIAAKPSTHETIFQDIFEIGIGAASIFVKNPASQQTAVNIINILKSIFPAL